MAWTYSAIILLLLSLLAQTGYVQACNDDCKDDLIQRFANLLDNKNSVLENKYNLKMEQISNTLTSHHDSIILMSHDLQSVKTRVEKYERNFEELKTLNFFIISQITDHLAQDRATQNPSSSQNINDLNDPINDLKTLTRESNVIMNEIRESIEDYKGTSNTTTQKLNDILENIEEMDLTMMKADNTTTQKLNDILENIEAMDQTMMEADNVTMDFMKMLSNEVERCPKGYLKIPASGECFKIYFDKFRSWTEANELCRAEGLTMAKPNDPVTLRNYINTHYGYPTSGKWPWVWLAARSTGSYFQWQPNGGRITSSSPLWWSSPGSSPSSRYCLYLLTEDSELKSKPQQPYSWSLCSYSGGFYALCQLVSE
ncbi:unnamed protein product [Meganyctiphanes norvegica]|uniref:C-type lectin domain-containing protein n=1 Tax=Meganyctiphanes norvegica TaxID=48144 RepID=A0AAV2QTS5_MEGNR